MTNDFHFLPFLFLKPENMNFFPAEGDSTHSSFSGLTFSELAKRKDPCKMEEPETERFYFSTTDLSSPLSGLL